jgi:hypothetical protein
MFHPIENDKENTMHARMIHLIAKPGRGKELNKIMLERSLPIHKQQPGFVDGIALNSDTEPEQFVGISIWKTAADADKFAQGQGQQLAELYKTLLQNEPTFRAFNLIASTVHDIAFSRAASG